MDTAPTSKPDGMDEDLWEFLSGPEPDEDGMAREAAVRYFARLTIMERFARHAAAQPVVEQLNALAAQHGLRSLGWLITGPVPEGAAAINNDAATLDPTSKRSLEVPSTYRRG